ncbi:glycosyltransferase family 2 protein [Arcicella rigui]|uniref:Glycosyltransferase family 2 protein n=1 Tax=Arcicella rigui TaxID=797020 RepID=A0ABU5Q647_9BACT|nr:glycosyltransferase family 2 protein [Arcicella rigui]MEA5137904.1 glycosyltransferase family 2 protein [Arcicella rigui]
MSIKLAIVMPAYNEQDCMADVVKIWSDLLDSEFASEETRLIVVNDGSKDNTGKILDDIQPLYPKLIVIHQKNGGHGNAVVHAYKKAVEIGAEYIFQTDSDDQFIPEDVKLLWEKRHQSSFILGYRQVRHDDPFRLLITRILRYSMFAVYGTFIMDSNIPFRLIEGNFLRKLLAQLPNPVPFAPNIFLAIMAKKAGEELFNIPIVHKERATGEVSIRKMKLLKVCWQSFKELLNFRLTLNEKIRNVKKQQPVQV